MDTDKEGEQPGIKKEGGISLGETFPLFTFNPEEINLGLNHHRTYSQPKFLEMGEGLPKIPIFIYSNPIPLRRIKAISPFDPERGYQVTEDDYKVGTRVRKILRGLRLKPKPDERLEMLREQLIAATIELTELAGTPNVENVERAKVEEVDETEYLDRDIYPRSVSNHPSMLSIASALTYELRELGFVEDNSFKPEVMSLVERLRLRLFFPNNSSFESRPDPKDLQTGMIRFEDFYPLETGHLATDPSFGVEMKEGLWIQVHHNRGELAQIQGRFILVPEGQEEEKVKPREVPSDIPEAFRRAFQDE